MLGLAIESSRLAAFTSSISLAWIAFITVLFVVPPNVLTGYIFGGSLVVLLVLYLSTARGRFKGPLRQANSEEEMLRIEAAYERI